MTYRQLMNGLNDGRYEVISWEGKGTKETQWVQLRKFFSTGRTKTDTIEITKIPEDAGRLA